MNTHPQRPGQEHRSRVHIHSAREELVKLDVLVDSGKRHPLNGQAILIMNPNLNDERLLALIESGSGADADRKQELHLAALRCALNAKFWEICSAIAGDISDAHVAAQADDAETLIDSWNEDADNWDLSAKTLRLLAEHREIGERIAQAPDEG